MRLGFAVLAAVLAFVVPAAAADWKYYEFPDQRFAVESPVPLVKGAGQYRAAIMGRVPTITYTGELDKIRYRVTVIDISKRIPDAVNLYEEMEALIALGGKVIGNDSVGIEPDTSRIYGRELVIEAKDGSLQRIALVYNKGKIYQAEGTVLPGGDKDAFYPERFADSIIFDLDPKAREARCADPDKFFTPAGK
jgi:hypothetical protein